MTSEQKRPLGICERLFERLNREGLRYCHFKSNEHLAEALAGETDLDLLVASGDRRKFAAILGNLDFKRVYSPVEKRYPDVEDYVGFDTETGGLAHLHVHYALILGQKNIKNHHLGIESRLLDDVRTMGPLRVPSAEMEMLLLVIRANMKLSRLHLLRYRNRRGVDFLPRAIVREFHFLARDWEPERFMVVVRDSGIPLSAPLLRAFVEGVLGRNLTRRDLLQTRAEVFRSMRGFRRSHPLLAAVRGLRGQLFRMRPFERKRPRKKTLPGRGISVALVGADGAGKTTLSLDLRAWLSWKLLAPPAYFGIPKQSRIYRAMRWVARSFGSPRLAARHGPLGRFASRVARLSRVAQWLFVARRRLAEYERVRRLTARGAVVITDRYPLEIFHSMKEPMDGPRIRREFGEDERRSADWEETLYARIGLPTKVLVLRTGLESLRARKPGLDLATHERKVAAVNAIRAGELFDIVDGERSYEEVLLDLKRRIWSLL